MADLPPELVEEILCRVPAMSLKRLRSICKRWNDLFRDQRFAKKHFDRPNQSLFFMLHEDNVFPLSVNLQEIDNNITARPVIEFECEISLFHCDGLLLLHLSTTEKDDLVVWNPCTGETKFIIPCNCYYENSLFALGYENNNSFRNYKILRYVSHYDAHYPIAKFEIYEFRSNTWRVLEVTTNLWTRCCGFSLKGNTYWLGYGNHLNSFDNSTERLGRHCLPFKDTDCCAEALSSYREEQLLVLHQRDGTLKIEIWVATCDKIDEKIVLSWTKFLAIDRYKLYGYHEFCSCISFFITEEKKVVVCCKSGCSDGIKENNRNMIPILGEDGLYREIRFGGPLYDSKYADILNYVPSLVHIQQSTP